MEDRHTKRSVHVIIVLLFILILEASAFVWNIIQQKNAKPEPELISCGVAYNIAVKKDGTAIVEDCYYAKGDHTYPIWNDIVSVSAGRDYIIGLQKDGKTVKLGSIGAVSDWENIVAISAGGFTAYGLRSDGTVVCATSGNTVSSVYSVNKWSNIIAISGGYEHVVGLKKDGTVVAAGSNDEGQCNVSEWTDIIAVSAGFDHTVGLKKDGTVVAVGKNKDGQCDLSAWTDIVAISAGGLHTVGIKADKTVVYAGTNTFNLSSVKRWEDIVFLDCGIVDVAGIKSDGSVMFVGYNPNLPDNALSRWTDLKTPEISSIKQIIVQNIRLVFPDAEITNSEYWISNDMHGANIAIWILAVIAACLISALLIRFVVIRKGLTWGQSVVITIIWCLIVLLALIACIYYSQADRFILAVPIIMSVAYYLILKTGRKKASPKEIIVKQVAEEKQQQQKQTDNNAYEPTESSVGQELLFCHKCGAKIQADSQFCHHCGAKIR